MCETLPVYIDVVVVVAVAVASDDDVDVDDECSTLVTVYRIV